MDRWLSLGIHVFKNLPVEIPLFKYGFYKKSIIESLSVSFANTILQLMRLFDKSFCLGFINAMVIYLEHPAYKETIQVSSSLPGY